MMKKRSISLLLAIVMVFAFSVAVFAAPSFCDIEQSWAKESIERMAEANVVTGYPDGTFRPDKEVTRAEFAQLLYNTVGKGCGWEDVENPFADVTADWYYESVMTLYHDGVIRGVAADRFEPYAVLTREQMVTMISRAAETYGVFELRADKAKKLDDFYDVGDIGAYAKDAFVYAYQTGLIQGINGNLEPQSISTRAQVVTVLDRCLSAEKILPLEISQEDWVDAKQYAKLSTGINMAYVEMGQADGEPVILLHGHTDSSRTWSLTAKELAKDFHVYILDQRGSGDTDAPDNRAYTTMIFANDVDAFMDSIGLEKAHIVGHSMGSANAQMFAALYPERTDRLVLMGSMFVDASESYKDARDKYAAESFDPTDPTFLDYWDYVTPGILEGKAYKAEVEEMMKYIKEDTSKIDRKAFVNPPTASTMITMKFVYDWITAPTLILCGESDVPRQMDLIHALSEDVYQGMIVYPGHNHSIQWENPYETGKDIAKFLKEEKNDKMVREWKAALPLSVSQEDWNDSKKYAQLPTGVIMAYVEMGDPNGEPVVMIHGGGGDTGRTFSLMAPYFAEAGYHVYAVDRKANGDSSAPKYGTYDMWGEAADIASFIEVMGYDKANIIGHSMGSLVCQGLQILYPEKIDKMVYYPNMTWKVSEFVPYTDADLDDAYYESWIYNEIPEEEWTDEYRNFLEWEIFDAKRCGAENLNLMHQGSANSDTTVALNAIDSEYLYIWGTLDYTPTSEIVKVLKATKNSKFLVYDGVGHNIQWEIPKQLAMDVMAYFEEKTPPTGYADKEYFLETEGSVIRYLVSKDIIVDYTKE